MKAGSWSIAGPTLLPDGTVTHRRVIISDGLIEGVDDRSGGDVEPGGDFVTAPGLIDLQINGAFGHDFSSTPAAIATVAARLPEVGVTAFAPTIVTGPPAQRLAAARVFDEPMPGAVPVGLHLEGPVIAPAKRGTHDPAWALSAERFTKELADLDHVALVTFAPELDPDHRLLDAISGAGIVAAMGHSEATYEEATRALNAGATLGTHLFNATAPLHHREPGLVGAIIDHPSAFGSVIADRAHLHPAVLRSLRRLLGDRLVLVSDAMAAAGLGDGPFDLGPVPVEVRDGTARNPSGDLAGSATMLIDALRELARTTGEPIWREWPAASRAPAAVLGDPSRGGIEPGRRADLTVVSPDGKCVLTVVGGEVVFGSLPLPRSS